MQHLRQQLKQGDKELIGNKGYRKYVQAASEEHFTIDEAKIKEEARYDGKWVLRTNLADEPEIIALAYKELWMVEDMFRTMKSILDTRPIYHKRDETIRGHVFCSFLALLLKRELERRLKEKGEIWEWAEILRGLDNRVASAIVCDGVSTAAVVFAPEYGNEDDHQIGSHICNRD